MKQKKQQKNVPSKSVDPNPELVNPLQWKEYSKWFLGIALLLTFIAYIPALSADFVNWDDQDYAMDAKLIQSFSNFSKFFTTPVQGNYHPLTMISLAINYAISGKNAFSYHLFNVLIHLVNVFLVYKFISKISNENLFVSITTAILFGVHPMHVESVAWVSERKDVLYTCFFLLGLIQYLNYIRENSKSHYGYCFMFFILSLASKPAAIIFPAVLFLLDYYKERNWSIRLITEKIPFFIFSAFMIYLTLHHQSSAGATDTGNIFHLEKRIFFVTYGYMMYIFKMIYPFNLVAFYPFNPINETLPTIYFVSPIILIGSLFLCYKTWKITREITFGIGFYLVNLMLVLQFFIVGSAIIADRYTYVPYIGLFFLGAWFVDKKFRGNSFKPYYFTFGISLILTVLSFMQSATWKNTATLWDHAIKKFPSAKAYTNRAYLYQKEAMYEEALKHYEASLKYNVMDHEVYANRGAIYFEMKQDSLAMIEYTKALKVKPTWSTALNGRGSLYANKKEYDLAIKDYNAAIAVKPDEVITYKNRAAAYVNLKQFDKAIEDYKTSIRLDSTNAEYYTNLGVVYMNNNQNELAIKVCEQALKYNPDYLKAYINIGGSYSNLKNFPKAIEYLNKAFEIDSTNDENLRFLSITYLQMGDTAKAMSYFHIAQRQKK